MSDKLKAREISPEEMRIQCYNGVSDTVGVAVTVADVILRIRHGNKGLSRMSRRLLELYQTDKPRYDKQKISLPAVTFAGTMETRAGAVGLSHSGLLVLDIDNLAPGRLAEVQEVVKSLPFVFLSFVSPSGCGLKVVIAIEFPDGAFPCNADEHEFAFRQVAAFCKQIGIEVDSGSDVNRLCFLVHDPNLFVRYKVSPFVAAREVPIVNDVNGGDLLSIKGVDKPDKPRDKPAGGDAGDVNGDDDKPRDNRPARRRAEKKSRDKRYKPPVDAEWDGEVDVSALDFIKCESLPYQTQKKGDIGWLEVGMACHAAGLDVSVWESWSRLDSARYKEGECQKKWAGFSAGGAVTWGSVVYFAKRGGYKTPKRKRDKPVKRRRRSAAVKRVREMSSHSEGAGETVSLFDGRSALGARMSSIAKTPVMPGIKELHFIPSDTGLGKTRAFLAMPESLLYIGTHGEGVDAAAEEAIAVGRLVLRWLSRYHGFNELYEECGGDRDAMVARAFGVFNGVRNMCAFADRAEKLAARGHSVEDNLCRNCPLNQECWERGYLSQYREAALAEVVCIALPDMQLVLDRAWASMARRLDRRVADDNEDAIDEGALAVVERVAGIDDATPWDLLVNRFVSPLTLGQMIKARESLPIVSRLMEEAGKLLPEEVATFGMSVSVMFLEKLRDSLASVLAGEYDNVSLFKAIKDTVALFQKEDGVWDDVIYELSRMPVYLIPRFAAGQWTVETLDGETFPLVASPGPGEFGFEVLGVERRSDIKRNKLYECFLSLGQMVDAGLAGYESEEGINAIPHVSDAKHGWVSSLTDLIKQVGSPENAPVSYNREEARVEWAVSPFLNFKRTFYLSATALESHVKLTVAGMRARWQLFSYPRTPVEWQAGCNSYQLVDGKMTERSYVVREGGEITGAAARLEDVVKLVRAQAEHEKVLFIGRKWLTDSAALSPVLSPVRSHEKVSIVNYHEMVGRNDFSDYGAVFLMLPEPTPMELEMVSRRLYRADSKPLSFEREDAVLASGDLDVEMKVYQDDRVQEVYETLISHDLYQGAMRLRPALSGDKQIVLLTAFPVAGLVERGVRLVSWDGLLAAEGGDVRNAIEYRADADDVRDAVRSGETVREAAEKGGVSTSQGYRDTVDVRREIKEKRNAWIRELHRAGETQEAIADAVGVSKRTVIRVLKTGR